MANKKAVKYKGKVCSPTVKGANSKDTKEWCKGKVGTEHDWWWYSHSSNKETNLPTELYKKCKRCGKRDASFYDRKCVEYSFGQALQAYRLARGLTVTQLSTKSGVQESYIHSLETSSQAYTTVSLFTMEQLTKALGLTMRVQIFSHDPSSWVSNREGLTIKNSPETLKNQVK